MSDRPTTTPDSDVYTVLLIIASIVTIAGTVYLCVRSQELFGNWSPFVKEALTAIS